MLSKSPPLYRRGRALYPARGVLVDGAQIRSAVPASADQIHRGRQRLEHPGRADLRQGGTARYRPLVLCRSDAPPMPTFPKARLGLPQAADSIALEHRLVRDEHEVRQECLSGQHSVERIAMRTGQTAG
jgi:hypothetical protein